MAEFQIYKKRDFSAFVNDTMQFFKQFWKNYFRNYIVINGALLLVMAALYYLVFKDLFKNMYNPEALKSWYMNNNNPVLFSVMILIFMVVGIAISIFTTSFPMVYLKLLNTTGRDSFTPSEMLNGIKNYAGRMILFGIISIFILFPVIVIFMAGAMALSIILIGIPVLILGVPTIMIWGMQSLYVYIEEESG